MYAVRTFGSCKYMIHTPTKYFNTSFFLKHHNQVSTDKKLFMDWRNYAHNMYILQRASITLDLPLSELFAIEFSSSMYDGLYIHPLLVNNFTKWAVPDIHRDLVKDILNVM